MSQTTEFYVKIMRAVDWAPNERFYIDYVGGEKAQPVRVAGLDLVLPNQAILQAANWEEQVPFHPLCESIAGTESPVHRRIREFMKLRIITAIEFVADSLISLACNTEAHGPLTDKQLSVLSCLPDATKKTAATVGKILNAAMASDEHFNMYVKRGGKVGHTDYHRVCVSTFVALTQIDADKRTIAGVTCSVKDFKQIPVLFETILPGINSGKLDVGSNSETAPHLVALLDGFHKVTYKLNAIMRRFRKYIPDYEKHLVPVEYKDDMVDPNALRTMAALIPQLQGNTGVEVDAPQQQATSTANTAASVAQSNAMVDRDAGMSLAPPVAPPVPAVQTPAYAAPTAVAPIAAPVAAPVAIPVAMPTTNQYGMPIPTAVTAATVPGTAAATDDDCPFYREAIARIPQQYTQQYNTGAPMMGVTMPAPRGNVAMGRESRLQADAMATYQANMQQQQQYYAQPTMQYQQPQYYAQPTAQPTMQYQQPVAGSPWPSC